MDYHLLNNEEVVQRPQGGGSGLDKYFLTVECFKMMGMQVSGERGRQIRQYFLNCEKELKRRIEEERERNKRRISLKLMVLLTEQRCVLLITKIL